jgi:Zn-dependent metalloprotease
MIEEDPTNEFRDKSFQKYDAVITDAQLTATTKQLAFIQKYTLWKDGLPIPVDLLLSDLTIQDKDKVIEGIQKQQQQQEQQAQQMAQLQMENQRIVNESLQSKALSDRSLAEERMMKGRLEQVAIQTKYNESEHQKALTVLDTVKAAKEVESMHVDDFVKVFSLIEEMKSNQEEKAINKGFGNC